MATNIGELVWKITGDTSNLDKSVKGAEKGVQKFGKAVLAAFSVVAVIGFAKKVGELGVKLVGLASDAEETANKFDVVFRGLDQASESAANLAANYGLSSESSQRLLADTADLLQGFGVQKEESLALSEATQRLAADLASFANKDPEDASRALTSALLGEREAVKSLGIAITDAELKRFAEEQGQVFEELDKGQKAVLTLELAYKQSANAIGDFERSQDSFSNQLKIARASVQDLGVSIGNDLLPVSTRAVTKFNEFATSLLETRKQFDGLKDAIDANKEGNATLEQQLQVLLARQERYSAATRSQKADIQAEIDQIRAQISARDTALARRDAELKLEEQQNQTKEETIELIDEETDAIERQNGGRKVDLKEIIELEAERENAKREARKENLAQERDDAEKRLEEIRVDAEEEIRLRREVASFSLGLAQETTSNLAALFKEGSKARKAALIADAVAEKASGVFNAIISTQVGAAKALELGFPFGPIAAGVIQAIGAINVGAILAKPIPALATGGIVPATPGGRIVQVAEGGRDEAIVPLDQGGIGGPMSITVNLDGTPIMNLIQSGLNRREIVVNQGSIA